MRHEQQGSVCRKVAGITAGVMGAAGNCAPPGGQPPVAEAGDDMGAFKQKIEKLKAFKEADMLSDEEFERERRKLLDSL